MRNTFLILSITLLTLTTTIHAQPDSLWSRTYGGDSHDYCCSMVQTSEGGYALAGYTESFGAGGHDMWFVGTNEYGEELWTGTYGGGEQDNASSIMQINNGDFVLMGLTRSFGEGNYDFLLVKTDPDGEEIWSNTYGGEGGDIGCCGIRINNGGFALAGFTGSFGAGPTDYWLVVTDEDGEELWSETYGGDGNDWCFTVIQTNDNGFVLAGETDSFGDGNLDFWLVRIDENGELLWSQSYGGQKDERCFTAIQTTDGGFALAGYTGSFGAGERDIWLIKTDEDGDSLWSQTFGGRNDEKCNSIIQTVDGGYVLAGYTASYGSGSSDMWLIRTNADGDSLWTKTFGGNDYDDCRSIIQTEDGGYVLAGNTNSFGAGELDFWLVKTDPDPVSVPSESFNPHPCAFALQPAYPDPFNSSTNIRFDLPVSNNVSISIFDLNGREVIMLLDDHLNSGSHRLTWDAKDFPAGLYLCRMEAGGVNMTRKLLLIK